jgi:hypothetical protein
MYALYALKAQVGLDVGWPRNTVQPVLYFYQMAQLLPVGTTGLDATLGLVAGLFNMQVHASGSSGFACPFPSLTPLGAIELTYTVPVMVASVLALGYFMEKQKLHPDPKVHTDAGLGDICSLRFRYQCALVKVATLAYSTMLGTTFQLLHCVNLGAGTGGRVLFRSATFTCGLWQAPLYLLAVVLVAPIVLGLAACCGLPTLKMPVALTTRLQAPYRERCGHWEVVLALHRLSVVAVYSFGGRSAAVSAVLQSLICITALAMHLLWQPFRERTANHAQAALLSCLVVVALLNVPQAAMDTNALSESGQMEELIHQLQGAAAALLLAPAAVMGAALLALAWQQRHWQARKLARCCTALARRARTGIAVFQQMFCKQDGRETSGDEQLEDSLLE